MSFSLYGDSKTYRQNAYGAKAERISQMAKNDLPIPQTIAISIDDVKSINSGAPFSTKAILDNFGQDSLLAIRSSPGNSAWGGVQALLNIGMNSDLFDLYSTRIDQEIVSKMYLECIKNYATNVLNIDTHEIDQIEISRNSHKDNIANALLVFEQITGISFPQCRMQQLAEAIQSMCKAWNEPTAKILRSAHGAPENASLGILVQEMANLGTLNSIDIYTSKCINRHTGDHEARIIKKSSSFSSVNSENADDNHNFSTEVTDQLVRYHTKLRIILTNIIDVDFSLRNNQLLLLDFRPSERSVAAELKTTVELVNDRIIDKAAALKRIEPRSLMRVLHSHAKRTGTEHIIAEGIAASPGAATGAIVFSSSAAKDLVAKGIDTVLVRLETGPEDIRTMHMAQGVVTGRGGMTSHAAVIARSLGVPCVSGAADLLFDARNQILIGRGQTILREGDIVTVDGSEGVVLRGNVQLVKPQLNEYFDQFLKWADEYRDIGIRANADSLDEANVAFGFGAEGIGLCRTEHMFFIESRLTVMREMIFADNEKKRRATLDELLAMQRNDFLQLFKSMPDKPLCIRLFDPPLHEFLPSDREDIRELAEALQMPVEKIIARTDELREFNPMLGMRGVRLGITSPEIYEMQARAIFEAVVIAKETGKSAFPEIMIPLVSANREVEIIKALVDKVAQSVREKSNVDFEYKLGVMVETPRAALRAGDLAEHSAFLSFGTNDLTQLTYGISRDDAARIIDEYVVRGVFPVDPFATLDIEGVAELLQIAAERSRRTNKDIVLSICGEHSADPLTIEYCRKAGFSYVSCSPYNVPIARLAAAHCTIP